jgi:5'-nucleotidase
MRRFTPLVVFLSLATMAVADRPITITFVHSNDLHAHVQPTSIRKVSYGGYARQATLIRQIREKERNVLLLSAGDTFQGTLYFNVYEGLADLAYMNEIGYQAMAVGNHEFDRGPATLATFVRNAQFPVLSANLNLDAEPLLKDRIQPSAVLTVGGERVGVVGCTTPDLPNISSPGPTVTLRDLRTSVQSAVDDLSRQGINKIVVLSHIGYAEDKQLASELHDVDLIIGGHSHTPLGTPSIPGWREPGGPYPTHARDARGQDVLIVQAYEWGKVLGRIKVDFDGKGRVRRAEGTPIVVDEKVPEDPKVKALLAALEKPILSLQNQRVGEARINIPKEPLPGGESLMANVIADAMLDATAKAGAVAAYINSGGVRGSFEAGPITYGAAISVQPFSNTLTVLELSGTELRNALEQGVGTGGELNPSRGSSYRIDRSRPKGQQVVDVVVAGQPLDPAKTYRLAFLNFTASGGDAHEILKNAKGTRIDTGLIDLDALLDYIKKNSPLEPKPENRIRVTG